MRRLASERGFTMIELLIAMSLLLVGIASTVTAFTASKSTTLIAQRNEVGVHAAQREIEKMRSLTYAELGLATATAPAQSSDPTNPNAKVREGGTFEVKSGLTEELVLTTTEPDGKISPGPERLTVGSGPTAVSVDVYRYVTWRDENCKAGLCDGNRNTKRLIVGVKLVASHGLGPTKPVWASTIAVDPLIGPAGRVNQPPAPAAPSAQSFFLYDKRCGKDALAYNNPYTEPGGSHDTRDTANAKDSTCEHDDKSPNLMGVDSPSYTDPVLPVPPFSWSKEYDDDFPGGLVMNYTGGVTSCPMVTYPDSSKDTRKRTAHAWATNKFTANFELTGTASVSLWTSSVGTAAGLGRICVTLVDRVPIDDHTSDDIVLGSTTYEESPWPTTVLDLAGDCGSDDFPCGVQRTITFNLTGGTRVRANGRLVLVISVLSTSTKRPVFLFDDPRYTSFVEVGTTTPCAANGIPCRNSYEL